MVHGIQLIRFHILINQPNCLKLGFALALGRVEQGIESYVAVGQVWSVAAAPLDLLIELLLGVAGWALEAHLARLQTGGNYGNKA